MLQAAKKVERRDSEVKQDKCNEVGKHYFMQNKIVVSFVSTDSRYFFRKSTLQHDKQKGWMRRRELSKVIEKFEQLWETDVDGIS